MAAVSEDSKRVTKNTLYLAARMLFVLLVSLYTTRVVLKVLGVEDYGTYNVVCGFVSMFSFLTSSLANATQRFYNFELGKNGDEGTLKIYCSSFYIQICLSLVLVILCEAVGLWYVNNKMVIPDGRLYAANVIFQLAILQFVLAILQVPYMALVIAKEEMGFYAITSIVDVLMKLAIALVLPYADYDHLIFYACLMTLISVVNILMFYTYSKVKFRFLSLRRPQLDVVREMLGFSGWNVFGTFASLIYTQGINVLTNLFFGPVVNAARAVSYQVMTGLHVFNQFGISMRPQIVKSYAQGNTKRSIALMFTLSKFSFLVFYVVSLPILFNIDFVLDLWLENVPQYTNILVILIFVMSVLSSINGAISCVVHATGKMKLYQISGSLTLILILPVAYLYLKMGGTVQGVYVICIIFSVIIPTIGLVVLRRLIPVFKLQSYFDEVVIRILLTVVLTIWGPILIGRMMPTGFPRIIVEYAFIILASIVCLFAFFANRQERNLMLSLTHLDKWIK